MAFQIYSEKSNRWRDAYNPLRGLSLPKLLNLLEAGERWFWVRDGMYWDWEYNQNAVSGRFRGLPIDPVDFVILDTVPLNRLLSVLYLGRTLTLKDWDSFQGGVRHSLCLPCGAPEHAGIEGRGGPADRGAVDRRWPGISAEWERH